MSLAVNEKIAVSAPAIMPVSKSKTRIIKMKIVVLDTEKLFNKIEQNNWTLYKQFSGIIGLK